MLSRLAREFAAEIANHDWSDAPWRIDRAGHHRKIDTNRGPDELTAKQTDNVRLNVAWVVAQVLGHEDPNLDITEFAASAGVEERRPGILKAGLRAWNGRYARPGTFDYDEGDLVAPAASSTPSATPAHPTSVLKVILDLDETTTWGDLRRFVELGAHEDADEKVFLERDPYDTDAQILGLSVYAAT
jgi:hypothetical protein